MSLFIADPTPVDRPTDVCPDPWTHARRMSEREQSWREKDNTAAGFCGWCAKKLDAREGNTDDRP